MATTAALDLIIRLKDEASKGLESVSSGLADIGKQAIGFAAGGVLLGGLETLAGGLQETFAGAFEDARGTLGLMAQTEAVIASTGGAAGVSAQQVADYAASLSDASGASLFGDDQIQQSQNLLLTFTNIKGSVLDAATAISVDMAQALGGAPKDSAIQLGKALNDPIAGITALTRVGVTFTEEQKAQVEAMQLAGDTAGAQGIILAELNKEFGGSAAAAAAATGGWSEFQGRLGEAAEGIAASLLPALQSLAPLLLDYVAPALETIAVNFAAFTAGLFSANDPIGYLVEQINTLLPGFQQVADIISANIVPILSSLAAMLAAVVVPAFIAWAGAAATAAGATIAALAPVIAPIAAIGAAVGLLVLAWQNDFGGIASFLTGWWEGTGRPIFEQLQQWLQVQLTAALQTLAQFWTNTLQPALAQVWSFIQTNVIPLLVNLGGTVLTQLGQAISLLANIWSTVLWPAIQTVAGWISGTLVPLLVSIGSVYLAAVGKAAELAAGVFRTVFLPPLQAVGDFISSTLGPALSSLANSALPPLKEGLGVVADVVKGSLNVALGILKTMLGDVRTFLGYINDRIQDTIGFFKDLARSINSIEIPDWLQGHSPPPLADWLAYIAEAASVAKDMLGGFGGTAQQLAGQIKSLSQSLIDDAFDGTISLARAQVNAIEEIAGFAGEGDMAQAQDAVRDAAKAYEDSFAAIDAQQEKIARMVKDGASNDALTTEHKKLDALKRQNGALQEQFTLAQQNATAAQQQHDFLQLIAQEAQGLMTQALQEAQALEATDPKAAADFFKMRRDQIMELADIQKRMAEGTTDAEYQALARQRDLIIQAQQVERMQFEEELARRRQAQIDATQQIFDDIGGVVTGQDKNRDGKPDPVSGEVANAWLDQLRDFTSLMQQGNMGIINFINTLTQMPVATAPGGLNAGPLGPNPAANITININGATGDNAVRALVNQGVQQGLAAAGINADLRTRGQ